MLRCKKAFQNLVPITPLRHRSKLLRIERTETDADAPQSGGGKSRGFFREQRAIGCKAQIF